MKKTTMYVVLTLVIIGAIGATMLIPNKPTQSGDWLPSGEAISVLDYDSNDSRSPAAFSIVDSNLLNEREKVGQKIYSKWCLPCHGENMPATNALEVVYQGDLPSLLEKREDLDSDIVANFVRYGKHSMPFFRKSEINNEELRLLGEYLSNAHKYIQH